MSNNTNHHDHLHPLLHHHHHLAFPSTVLVDGLSDGIVNQTIHYSLLAKAIYPWTDTIPKSVYLEYVVPYAIVNEPRTDHRGLLFHALRDILKQYERKPNTTLEEDTNGAPPPTLPPPPPLSSNLDPDPKQHILHIKEAVKLINAHLWSILGKNKEKDPILFQAGLTPRIYDPLSVIAHGRSSCTGLAILLMSALRSVGIPCRLAGTPAWNGNIDHGNHSWLEVYLPGANHDDNDEYDRQNNIDGRVRKRNRQYGQWIFLEPTPGIVEGNEGANGIVDDLDRDPCRRWFCNPEHFDGKTQVFVTRYNQTTTTTNKENKHETKEEVHYFPMAWSDVEEDRGVPGEDLSEYYTRVCGMCPN